MLVAISGRQQRNIAWQVGRSQAPFFCPSCKEEVILKKGKIRIHHFSHKPSAICIYGNGESQKHYEVKTQIYKSLVDSPNCSQCELEKPLPGVRPDISLIIGKIPVAIEIQKSAIDIDEIIRRSICYSKLGYCLLWVMPDEHPHNMRLEDKETEFSDEAVSVCRPTEWQKFLHAMYFGRLYFWQREAIITPVHFGKFTYYVEKSNWVEDFYDKIGENLEGTYWHDEHYNDATAGGYWKTSKSQKLITWPEYQEDLYLHIAKDFQPRLRNKWSAKYWTIPACNLWGDRLQKWWH